MSKRTSVDDHCRAVYLLLQQDKHWFDARGTRHDIDEMSVRYKRNVIGFLERRPTVLAWRYGFGEIDVIFGGGDAPMGEMAQDAVEHAMDEDDRQRMADPLAWLRTTPLMVRLASDVVMGLGGTAGDDEHRRYIARREGCAAYLSDGGHTTYDDDCAHCVAYNSDAPEWTIS